MQYTTGNADEPLLYEYVEDLIQMRSRSTENALSERLERNEPFESLQIRMDKSVAVSEDVIGDDPSGQSAVARPV